MDPAHVVHIAIRHGGLRGRILGTSSPNRFMRSGTPTEEDEIETEIHSSLDGLQTNLVGLVKEIVSPLLVVFDFFQLDDATFEEIVNAYVEGRVV